MKKKFASVFAALMLLPTLAACSGGTAADGATNTTADSTQAPTVTETQIPTVSETQAEFEEIVLVDDENVIFKITAIDNDSIWGYTLNVYLENKTDVELMYSLDDVSVNGFMCDPFWATTVSGGMKANEEISFSESDFEKNGITEVTDITFTLSVYDSNNWSADHLMEEVFTINP